MRKSLLLALALVLAGTAPAQEPIRTPQAQAKFDKLLAGRVAGETKLCLKTSAINNPIAIDDRTMLFSDGPRVWRNDLQDGFHCSDLGLNKALVTVDRNIQACRGDKVQIVDMKGRYGVGACILGDFTLYSKPQDVAAQPMLTTSLPTALRSRSSAIASPARSSG